jgi:hypothetical protein
MKLKHNHANQHGNTNVIFMQHRTTATNKKIWEMALGFMQQKPWHSSFNVHHQSINRIQHQQSKQSNVTSSSCNINQR